MAPTHARVFIWLTELTVTTIVTKRKIQTVIIVTPWHMASSNQFSRPSSKSEIVRVWQLAVQQYEANAGAPLASLPGTDTVDGIPILVKQKETAFRASRNSNSKVDRVHTALKCGMHVVEKISEVCLSATSTVGTREPRCR